MAKMILPFLVVHRGGAELIRDEAAMPPEMRARFIERRRHRPMWYACNGMVIGSCLTFVITVAAQAGSTPSEWTQPSTVIAIAGMIFAGGQMWNARQDDRRRIAKLEESSVTQKEFQTLADSVLEVSRKIDRLIERG